MAEELLATGEDGLAKARARASTERRNASKRRYERRVAIDFERSYTRRQVMSASA